VTKGFWLELIGYGLLGYWLLLMGVMGATSPHTSPHSRHQYPSASHSVDI